jgi:hypothetical protein
MLPELTPTELQLISWHLANVAAGNDCSQKEGYDNYEKWVDAEEQTTNNKPTTNK